MAAGTRAPGGGKKSALPTGKEKLLFVLYYFKVYSTFDVLSTQFNMSRSRAHEHVYKLAPVLDQTLVELSVMSHRKFTTTNEFREAIEDIETLLIDVTERNYRRPQDNKA
ncbi:MAG: transposase family protein [Chloroflexi bacterium]|nr:transposase family protein [Chloroflexota bacterium]